MAPERNPEIFPIVRKRRHLALSFALAAVFCLSPRFAPASEPKPVRPFYNQFSSDDEARLGVALADKIEREGIPVAGKQGEQRALRVKRDAAAEHYLESIAAKLARVSQRPEIQYSVRILDAPDVINAFSIPGGHIYITSGLLDFVQTEAELVAVLGHEVGHIVARHTSNRIARASLFTFVISEARQTGLIADDATAQKLADTAMPLLFALDSHTFYSRDDEIEADLLSFYEMARAGWDPEGEISLLARLAKASPEQNLIFSLIATHPDPSARLQIVRAEYGAPQFSAGLRRDSPEFRSLKSAMHKSTENGPSSRMILPILIGVGTCASLLVTGILRSRRQRTA